MNFSGLSLLITLVCTTTAFASANPVLDVAKVKANRTLFTVQSLNHASTGAISIAPGQTCEVYTPGSIRLLAQSPERAVVEYRPALVFLHDGVLLNLWGAAKAGIGAFCPPGTRFEIHPSHAERLDAARLLTIQEQVLYGDGLAWASRHLRLARESRLISLGAERWAAILAEDQPNFLASAAVTP